MEDEDKGSLFCLISVIIWVRWRITYLKIIYIDFLCLKLAFYIREVQTTFNMSPERN